MKTKVLTLLFCLLISVVSVGQKSRLKKFKNLSGPEKCWVMFHPFVAQKALKISELSRLETKKIIEQKLLIGNGSGGQVDAFRHTFWMAKLTVEIGWRKARKLGLAHEKGNYRDFKKRRNEEGVIPDKISSEMDLFNNAIGIEIGKSTSENEIIKTVIEAVKTGQCKIIKRDGVGNFLDCEGNIIPTEQLKGKWENEKCLVWSSELMFRKK